jgi:ABC-type molybdate transport system substrate-binding protein
VAWNCVKKFKYLKVDILITMKKSLTAVLCTVATLLICACQTELVGSDASTAPIDGTRQIKVLTSGGFTAAYNILAPQFEQTTGFHPLTTIEGRGG